MRKDCKCIRKGILAASFFLLLAGLAFADYREVQGTAGAMANIVLENNYRGDSQLKIEAEGLEAGGIYTVWLVNKTPKMSMAGVGEAPYAFVANVDGKGSYIAKLTKRELQNWQMIKVVLHRDANAENMNKSNLASVFAVETKDFLSGNRHHAAPEGGSYEKHKQHKHKMKMPEAGSW